MRLRVLSDLHLERGDPFAFAPRAPGDILVAAGDIAGSCAGAVAALRGHGPAVVIPGNHEHYGHVLQDNVAAGFAAAVGGDVRFLSRSNAVIGGVRFIGATLWTNYDLYDDPALAMRHAEAGLNDHRLIGCREASGAVVRFTPRHAREAHEADLAFIAYILSRPHDGPTVVVTHHLPTPRAIAEKFRRGPALALNPAFASDLEALILHFQPDVWVHGHSHASSACRIGKTLVVCNPKGYGGENPAFSPLHAIVL